MENYVTTSGPNRRLEGKFGPLSMISYYFIFHNQILLAFLQVKSVIFNSLVSSTHIFNTLVFKHIFSTPWFFTKFLNTFVRIRFRVRVRVGARSRRSESVRGRVGAMGRVRGRGI